MAIIRLLLSLGLLGSVSALYAAAPYLQVQSLPGDGVYSMLRRYELDAYRCNFDKFYALNKLSKNATLHANRTYYLPIEVFAYNGRSIRSTIGNDDYNFAIKIQQYNRSLETRGIVSGAYETTKRLLVPHHLENCPSSTTNIPATVSDTPEERPATTPPKSSGTATTGSGTSAPTAGNGQRMFPIFGPTYAYTPLASTALRGKVFYIISGHGGPDPGAMGQRANHTLCEDEYAYDVALRLCRNLIAHGATAYMICRDENDGIRDEEYLDCDNDEVVWGDASMSRHQRTRLTQRTDIVNALYDKHRLQGVTEQTVVEVHVDSRSKSQRTDVFFYYHPSSEDGRTLAQRMQETFQEKYRRYRSNGDYTGTISARDLHTLRESKAKGVYIELANIKNSTDQQRIILTRNRELLAQWMLEGLMAK